MLRNVMTKGKKVNDYPRMSHNELQAYASFVLSTCTAFYFVSSEGKCQFISSDIIGEYSKDRFL